MNLISVKNLYFSFSSGPPVLENVSFSIRKGEFAIIAGRNGSGKTVLMKHLNGLLLPDRGEICFRDYSTRDNTSEVRKNIGLVFQDAEACIVGNTVMEDLVFGPENIGLSRAEYMNKGETILKEFGLWEKKDYPPRFLSGGEKKKLTIASILIMAPEVIILDEPFVGLDCHGVCEILKILLTLKTLGRTVVLISHDLEKVLAHGDRLIVMEKGRIAADGSPAELLDSLENWGIRRASREIGRRDDMADLLIFSETEKLVFYKGGPQGQGFTSLSLSCFRI